MWQVKAITSLFIYVRTPLFQGGPLPPANPAISEPVFPAFFLSILDFIVLQNSYSKTRVPN